MPAVAVLAGLLLIISYSMSHSVVTVDGTDWIEPVLLWISICMPTGSGKSSLCKYLRKLVEDARSQNGTGDSEPSWFLDDQSFEKMGALMCDNSWKLLGLYDELPMFLSQINVFRGRGLADSHELALLLQLYGGSQWVRKTGKLSNLNGYGYIIHVHARAYTHYTIGHVLIASIYQLRIASFGAFRN